MRDLLGAYNDWGRDTLALIRSEAALSYALSLRPNDSIVVYFHALRESDLLNAEGRAAFSDLVIVRDCLVKFPVIEVPVHPTSADFTFPKFLASFEQRVKIWKSSGGNWKEAVESVNYYVGLCRATYDLVLRSPTSTAQRWKC